MTGLKISFFGSSLVSAYWNGAATYYRGILKALFQKGYVITFYEPDAYDRQKHRDIDTPEYADSYIFENSLQGVNKALAHASDADIIIKASGVGVFDDTLERGVLSFQNSHKKVLFWDVDSPATLARIQSNPDDPFRTLIPLYDCIFSYGGGKKITDTYNRYGAKNCYVIYNALDSDTHFPVPKEDRYDCSLGFLGNRLPDREERVSEFFMGTALLMPQKSFMIGGNGWNMSCLSIPNIKCLGHVYTYDHNSFNSSCFTILNIIRNSMASCGYSPPTRIFEAAGAGACIITDCWEGIEEFLTPDYECLIASTKFDVAEHLRHLDIHTRNTIGRQARERVLSEHTYRQRAETVHTIFMDYI